MKRNWIWILCFVSILLNHDTAQDSFSKDPVRLYFFYSEESGGAKAPRGIHQASCKEVPPRD